MDLQLTSSNEIPTEYFLNCCSDLLSLIDNFGSSAFLPVKIDVYGNISVINFLGPTSNQSICKKRFF